MHNIFLNKSIYSERVVRKSLYWISEYCNWSFGVSQGAEWNIQIVNSKISFDLLTSKLHQLLNDNILREEHDANTKELRKKVIKSVLENAIIER